MAVSWAVGMVVTQVVQRAGTVAERISVMMAGYVYMAVS